MPTSKRCLSPLVALLPVFKGGDEAQKQAFVVGKTVDGKWAGLKTTVVET